jgi:hypothetical protein
VILDASGAKSTQWGETCSNHDSGNRKEARFDTFNCVHIFPVMIAEH